AGKEPVLMEGWREVSPRASRSDRPAISPVAAPKGATSPRDVHHGNIKRKCWLRSIAAARSAHHLGASGWSTGANAMRAVLALSFLIAFCATAEAAKVYHAKPPRHVILRSSPVDPRFPPVLQDQTPSYNDPSRYGGG